MTDVEGGKLSFVGSERNEQPEAITPVFELASEAQAISTTMVFLHIQRCVGRKADALIDALKDCVCKVGSWDQEVYREPSFDLRSLKDLSFGIESIR